jgi:hypothetical protein
LSWSSSPLLIVPAALLLFDVVLTSKPSTGKVSPHHNKEERVLYTGGLNRQRPVSLAIVSKMLLPKKK